MYNVNVSLLWFFRKEYSNIMIRHIFSFVKYPLNIILLISLNICLSNLNSTINCIIPDRKL